MKGPGYKTANDVRRTWRCPACERERKVSGDITSLVCDCKPEGTFMAIVVERTVAPRPFQTVHEHEVRSSEFGIEDMPVLQPHPSSLPPERTGPRRPRPHEGSGAEPTVKPPSSDVPKAEMPNEKAAEPAPPAPAVEPEPVVPPAAPAEESADDWGEGIL